MPLIDDEPGKAMFDEVIQLFGNAQSTMAEIASKLQSIQPQNIDSRLNGLTFERISEEDFDNIDPKDPNTIYYVYDEKGTIRQYIGNQSLTGMSVTAGAIIPSLTSNLNLMMIGTIEEG